MAHLAMVVGDGTTWLGAVSEEEYTAALASTRG